MENKDKKSNAELRLLYADILNGYCRSLSEKYGDIYIKHLDTRDAAEMDYVRDGYYQDAKEKGLPTEKEKLAYLDKNEEWTAQEENELEGQRSYVKQLELNKSKLFLDKDRNQIINQIKETRKDVEKKELTRLEFVGITSESFSAKKANEYYIFKSLFKNKDCSETLLSAEDFDELNAQGIYELVEIYNEKMKLFASVNLKRIALSGFFLNFFYLCEDNPLTFFGKPAVNLTFYEAELFGHAKYFKQILQDSKNKPPHDIMDDPDAIINWYESSKGAQAAFDKAKASGNVGGSSIVGASKDEMTKLGAIDEGEKFVDLAAEAMKKGGSLNMDELIKLHGH
tara:strand:+ start:1576 stop:2595 length:1020 start_codon:yes stop_codon:yes gene_type:complete